MVSKPSSLPGRKQATTRETRSGQHKTTTLDLFNNNERSQMVQQEIRLTEEEDRQSRAIGMGGQCAWTRWKTTERHLTWADIWHYEPLRLKFLLRSVYDLLPSPANLHRWDLVEDPRCHLRNKPGTMQHAIIINTVVLSKSKMEAGRSSYRLIFL